MPNNREEVILANGAITIHVIQIKGNLLERYHVRLLVHGFILSESAILKDLIILPVEVLEVKLSLAPVKQGT